MFPASLSFCPGYLIKAKNAKKKKNYAEYYSQNLIKDQIVEHYFSRSGTSATVEKIFSVMKNEVDWINQQQKSNWE